MARATADPVLLRTGVSIALRAIAYLADGIEEPDRALEWCVNVGYLRYIEREVVAVTPEGERVVYAWWTLWQAERKDGTNLGRSGRPLIHLPNGSTIDVGKAKETLPQEYLPPADFTPDAPMPPIQNSDPGDET